MTERTPYILKNNEVNALLAGLAAHGASKTFEQMKGRATTAMEKSDDIDEMFLDMYDGMLKRARKTDDKGEKELQSAYYLLTSMLWRLAHEIHFAYLKSGKQKDSTRFIHLVSNNPDAPSASW